jgi:hypothetical protein
MLEKFNQYRVKHLWHFTDKSNLDNIVKNGGLLSLREITNRNLSISIYGGNQWSHDADRRKELDQYIHLAFVDDHPMLYRAKQEGRINEPIWLTIDVTIIQTLGTMYSTDVSNKAGISIINGSEAKKEIDFDVLFTYMDWKNQEIQQRRQAAIKSEILIPNFIPIEKIKGWKNG